MHAPSTWCERKRLQTLQIRNKLRCTVYSDTFLSEPALTFSVNWATVYMGQSSLPACINGPCSMSLSPVQHSSFLGPLLIDIDHCRPGVPHKSCRFGDFGALTQSSSHYNLALVKFAQILTLFPASNSSTLWATCSLAAPYIPPTNRCHDDEIISVYSLHLSVVIMLCLISVFYMKELACFFPIGDLRGDDGGLFVSKMTKITVNNLDVRHIAILFVRLQLTSSPQPLISGSCPCHSRILHAS